MEEELNISSSLMSQPKKDIVSLGKAQLGFMNLFALPLFQGVADLMPAMQYCVDELEVNKVLFERKIEEEQDRMDPAIRMLQKGDGGTYSPRTMSMAVTPDITHTKASLPTQKLLAASAPTVLTTRTKTEQEFMTQPVSPTEKPADVPRFNVEHNRVNGLVTSFESVADFAASDPFNMNDEEQQPRKRQRCSETTEGSSLPYSAEWASGATSATTGKMPLSPSTQGTSVVSRDSMDRPVSVPVTTVTAPESITTAPESTRSQSDLKGGSCVTVDDDHDDRSSGNGQDSGTLCPTEGILRKKPSRFRMHGLKNVFRRHKGASGTGTTDAAG